MGSNIVHSPLLLAMCICVTLFVGCHKVLAKTRYFDFTIEYASMTRLCHTKNGVITVNGQFPGPASYVYEGDEVVVNVTNLVDYNATIHWHGVRQLLSAWADGPAYITQCPIQSGRSYVHRFTVINQRGTLFWHAHYSWLRATVHGAFIILPKPSVGYPFPAPKTELPPLVLGEWWNADVESVIDRALITGGPYNISDALTINGQPGLLYNCSAEGTFVYNVERGQTYLLRIINAAVNFQMYFAIKGHMLTVVETDAEYTEPYTTDIILIAPGQTTNVLFTANAASDAGVGGEYIMAASVYSPPNASQVPFPTIPTTAILRYGGNSDIVNGINANLVDNTNAINNRNTYVVNEQHNGEDSNNFVNNNKCTKKDNNGNVHPKTQSSPTKGAPTNLITNSPISLNYSLVPSFPAPNDTLFQAQFTKSLKGLNVANRVPKDIDIQVLHSVGYALQPCPNPALASSFCQGPNGTILRSSISNLTFITPYSFNILGAYYEHIVNHPQFFTADFPDLPFIQYNYTAVNPAIKAAIPATKVRILPFNASVQVVYQDTATLFFESHPIHLHGHTFFVVGTGNGTFNPETDPPTFNLVNPHSRNTVAVPPGGWAAIRFRADNPGAWFVHCHFDIHQSWGMNMVFITENGEGPSQTLPPPPSDFPRC